MNIQDDLAAAAELEYMRECVSDPQEAAEMLAMEQEIRESIMRRRPSWTNYFLGLAFQASRRSHDTHTKHGCVLVDQHHHVLSMGYNGFPEGMDGLPLTRPSKYDWMDHSEPNAIANCTESLWRVPGGALAYVTGQPCFPCLRALRRHNVRRIIIASRHGYSPSPKQEAEDQMDNTAILCNVGGIIIERVTPNLDWMFDIMFVRELYQLGFITTTPPAPTS